MLSRRALVAQLAGAVGAATLGRGASAADLPLVALVHTQAAGDGGLVDGMIAHLKQLGRDRNVNVRAIYAGDPTNYQPILELLGEARAAVVLTTFNEMTQPIKAVAPNFPATRFVLLYSDPLVPALANARTVQYDSYLASYLSGICGAHMSTSGKLGYIAGANLPELNASLNAMIAGARSVRPASSVAVAFVGSFQDPSKALEIANQMFDGDVDYVQAEAASSDQGTIQSANHHTGKIISAGVRAMFALGPTTVAAVTQCDFGMSLSLQASAALETRWTGGHYVSNFADGVIDFVQSPLFVAHAAPSAVAKLREVWPAIVATKTRIAAGALRVPFKTLLG